MTASIMFSLVMLTIDGIMSFLQLMDVQSILKIGYSVQTREINCSVSLPRGAMGRSAEYDRGISWSYPLYFLTCVCPYFVCLC